MTISNHHQKTIDEFFNNIKPLRSAYVEAVFNYVAIKQTNGFVILQARVFLNTSFVNYSGTHFEFKNIKAGSYKLSELNVDLETLVNNLISGCIKTPHGDLYFSPDNNGSHNTFYQPFLSEGLQNNQRINVIFLTGAPIHPMIRQPELDWELKSSPEPYDSLQELLFELQLGNLRDNITVEMVAFQVAVVDLASPVTETTAEVAIRAARNAITDEITLGYKIFSQGKVIARSQIQGKEFKWSNIEEGEVQRGVKEIQIPPASILQCIAIYGGIAQHQGWLADRTLTLNPRRAVYETFDKGLTTLVELLRAQGRGIDARNLEAAVSWLLWMLGFNVAHLGGTPRTQEAADLIATTPNGHFAVIECTTGLLKADHKLPLVHERAQAVRRNLDISENRYLTVLPVIVTSKLREEILPDIDQAEKLGILVITKEDLDKMLDQTLAKPNADQIYTDAEKTVQEAKAKHLKMPLAA